MKLFITLCILSAQLFALNIVLNSGKESKVNYAILHIIDTQALTCETIADALEKKRYLCKAKHPFDKPIESKKMKFAELDFYEKEGIFYIAIEPKTHSKLMPVEDTLYETTTLLAKPKMKEYRHWMILFQDAPLYKEKKVHDGLDFSVKYEKYQKPYIGALDLNGAPISYAQSKDIGLYLELKREYENGNFDSVVKDAKKVLSLYPLSIFRSEIELYSMRAMDKILSLKGEDREGISFEEGEIVNIAKRWTKEFASDENIPEVFMLMAKSYLKMGAKSDANYFIDILVSEHAESPFTKRAILLFADNLYVKKEKEKAMKLYLEVLYSVKDLDIASEAAIRLSDGEMDAGKMTEAKEYLHKVLNVNAAFLLKDKEATYKLAKRLYAHKIYDVAAKLSDLLLEEMPKRDQNRELLIKESGDWHAKAGNVEKAYARYQGYLSDYKNGGDYIDEVRERLDELFFKRNETNESLLATHYDKLIDQYNNTIGHKALAEKAKLLLKQGKYEAVLELVPSLSKLPESQDIHPESLIYEAAQGLALIQLKNDACSEVVSLIETYKLQFEGNQQEEKLFSCLMSLSRYERAKEISGSHLKDTKLENRYKWAQRDVNVLFKMGKYQEAIAFKEDLFTLEKRLKTPIGLETFKNLFLANVRLKQKEEMLSLAQGAEERYPKEFTLIDVYNEIVKIAIESKNDLLLVSYAQKILNLQKQFKSAPLSPMIEFNYAEALKRLGKEREALDIILAVSQEPLSTQDKIRVFYTAGELSMKLKDDEKAKEYFKKCVDINESSSWKNICEENLKLF